MALLGRIYFNAVFGALGGLLGWVLFGILGEKNPSREPAFLFFSQLDWNTFLGGMLIGGSIGYFIVSVEALRDRAPIKFARLASYGLLLGAVGGGFGMYLGDLVNALLIQILGDHLGVTMLARAVGWSLLGVAVGMSEGIAARSLGKFYYGTIGGLLGGFIGGALFELFYFFSRQSLSTTYFWAAMGIVILGACIGMLSALVQAVFQPASVKVMRGWQEGREYPLDKPASLLGRDEHADIALFRDMKVEKKHAYIQRLADNRFQLVNNGSPADQTLVNETPVSGTRELQDGDRIQLGNVILKFQMRAAMHRQKGRLQPVGS